MSLDDVFLWEVKAPGSTLRSIAVCYALLIAEEAALKTVYGPTHEPRDWREINDSIMLYYRGVFGLERVKTLAWKIHDGLAKEAGL